MSKPSHKKRTEVCDRNSFIKCAYLSLIRTENVKVHLYTKIRHFFETLYRITLFLLIHIHRHFFTQILPTGG